MQVRSPRWPVGLLVLAPLFAACGESDDDRSISPADRNCSLSLQTEGALELDETLARTDDVECLFERQPARGDDLGPSFRMTSFTGSEELYVRVLFGASVELTHDPLNLPVRVNVRLGDDSYLTPEGACTADVRLSVCEAVELERLHVEDVHCDAEALPEQAGAAPALALEELELMSGCRPSVMGPTHEPP